MTTISIIGSGNMATAIGTRAAKHGHTIEFMKTGRWTCSSPATAPRRKPMSPRFWRAWTCDPSTQEEVVSVDRWIDSPELISS